MAIEFRWGKQAREDLLQIYLAIGRDNFAAADLRPRPPPRPPGLAHDPRDQQHNQTLRSVVIIRKIVCLPQLQN